MSLKENLRKNSRNKRGLLLTPLIDIIFLLCLFFVLNTSFREKSYIEVNLPESETSEDNRVIGIILTMYGDGSVSIDGKVVGWDLVESTLQGKAGDQTAQEIIIQGDEGIDYERIIAALDKVRRAGFERISLQTIRSGR